MKRGIQVSPCPLGTPTLGVFICPLRNITTWRLPCWGHHVERPLRWKERERVCERHEQWAPDVLVPAIWSSQPREHRTYEGRSLQDDSALAAVCNHQGLETRNSQRSLVIPRIIWNTNYYCLKLQQIIGTVGAWHAVWCRTQPKWCSCLLLYTSLW